MVCWKPVPSIQSFWHNTTERQTDRYRYSLLININKTKVMASDGIACRILIQNEQLAQVNTFPYLGSLITEDGECTTEFRTRLSRGEGRQSGHHCRKYGKVTAYRFQEDKTNESPSVACSHVRLWKLDTQEEWRNTSWGLWDERTERVCIFRGQQRKQMSGFSTKLE